MQNGKPFFIYVNKQKKREKKHGLQFKSKRGSIEKKGNNIFLLYQKQKGKDTKGGKNAVTLSPHSGIKTNTWEKNG